MIIQTITGRWKVTDSEMLPFGHISYCENLTVNAVFEFKSDETLEVYPNEKQTYEIKSQTLEMLEDDMLFNYRVVKLTKDSLVLNIPHLSSGMRNKMDITQVQLDNIRKNGFNVTLVKIS